MDLGLKDKGVVVLASSKGLGRASAKRFAMEGANVMLSGRHEETLAEAAAEIKEATGRQVWWKTCDQTKAEDLTALIEEAHQSLGQIDVLVNNSGGPAAGSFESLDDEAWLQGFELTLFSFIRATRAALPYLKETRGRIVNIASSSVKEPVDQLMLSNTFRMGMKGWAKTLSKELANDGILINTVGPGRIATDRTEALDHAKAERTGVSFEEIREQNAVNIPLGRYGTPDEFAQTIVFLGSPANTYVSGQTIVVDGAMTKAY